MSISMVNNSRLRRRTMDMVNNSRQIELNKQRECNRQIEWGMSMISNNKQTEWSIDMINNYRLT